MTEEEDKKRKKVKKPSAEVLQRRKEGRIKAAAALASNLKKTGIMRVEESNGFPLSSIKPVPLINQKNYFTDYLKKDEQIVFIRRWRAEKLLKQKLKKLNSKKPDDGQSEDGPRNFDDFNLNDIEEEMKRKNVDPIDADDDDEDDDDENGDVDVDADGEAGETDGVVTEKARIGSDVVVIHPGSSNFRIGKAVDAVPECIPAVVAIRHSTSPSDYLPEAPQRDYLATDIPEEDKRVWFGEEFEACKSEMTKDFKARMRFYKRRVLPNSREVAANFNKRKEPEVIPEHNDPHKTEWIDVGQHEGQRQFVGEDALKLPICDKFGEWKLRSPIVNGRFNESSDYGSREELLGDISSIINLGLSKLDITNVKDFKCMLIIPDLYDKVIVEQFVQTLLQTVGFGRVAYLQESVAASFGAGTSSACIIDVGSQTTTVACVDEGLVINDSRIRLNFGGDNITETLTKFLLQSFFPCREINLNYQYDWQLAQTLKHDFVTFQDADIAVQIYNFYRRKPFEHTLKYEFKVFDEVMLAPLGLFYPNIFTIQQNPKSRLFPKAVDQYSLKSNNPSSKSQENIVNGVSFTNLTDEDLLERLHNSYKAVKGNNPFAKAKLTSTDINETAASFPLERAIIESITNACLATDITKVKKFYSNLLFVGGGLSKIPGFDTLMTDRINIWRPKFLSTSNVDELLEYVEQQEKKSQQLRQKLVREILASHGPDEPDPADESALTPEELASVDEQCQLTLDLDYVDSLVDKGQLLPVTVLPPPREFDPEILTWKGGSIYGRLKVVNEMWISQNEWDLLGSRCLYYKSLYNY